MDFRYHVKIIILVKDASGKLHRHRSTRTMEDVEAKLARLWKESATNPHTMKTRANILIIDDEQYRHRWFNRTFKDMELELDIRTAYDADQALEQMRETQFDVVFFDHDLGAGPNGSRLATMVLGDPFGPGDSRQYKWPYNVFIHSLNWNGARNIESKFKSAGVRTFFREISLCIEKPKDFLAVVNALIQNLPIPFGADEFRRSDLHVIA